MVEVIFLDKKDEALATFEFESEELAFRNVVDYEKNFNEICKANHIPYRPIKHLVEIKSIKFKFNRPDHCCFYNNKTGEMMTQKI